MRASPAGFSADEWSRYYHLPEANDLEVLHARFVEHRFGRHSHEYFVVSYVEQGVQSYYYRGLRRVTSAGQVFLVNAGEPHTGEPASEQGYVYRALYPRASLLEQVAAELTGVQRLPYFDDAVIDDPRLAGLLRRFHLGLVGSVPRLRKETSLHAALAHLIVHYTGRPPPFGVRSENVQACAVRANICTRISPLMSRCTLSPRQRVSAPITWHEHLREK